MSGWKRLLIFLNTLSLGLTFYIFDSELLDGIPSRYEMEAAINIASNYKDEYQTPGGAISFDYKNKDYNITAYVTKADGGLMSVIYPLKLISPSSFTGEFNFPDGQSAFATKEQTSNFRSLEIKARSLYTKAYEQTVQSIIELVLNSILVPSLFVAFLFGINWVTKGFKKKF